jgi:hypothetical protein
MKRAEIAIKKVTCVKVAAPVTLRARPRNLRQLNAPISSILKKECERRMLNGENLLFIIRKRDFPMYV